MHDAVCLTVIFRLEGPMLILRGELIRLCYGVLRNPTHIGLVFDKTNFITAIQQKTEKGFKNLPVIQKK